MKKNIHIFKTPEEVVGQFSDLMMKWIGESAERPFHVAISGGKTPDLLFNDLTLKYAESALWQKVHFWWVDERMVSPIHPESNFGVANRLLLTKIKLPEENIHRIKGENEPETEAISYSRQIQKKLIHQNEWPQFDLIILGIGDDGHTASIFPNQMQLLNSNYICEVATHPQSGQKRVTLTGKVIDNALKVCFLVIGSNKAERMADIINNTKKAESLPAAHIHPVPGNLDWYADEAAANNIHS